MIQLDKTLELSPVSDGMTMLLVLGILEFCFWHLFDHIVAKS